MLTARGNTSHSVHLVVLSVVVQLTRRWFRSTWSNAAFKSIRKSTGESLKASKSPSERPAFENLAKDGHPRFLDIPCKVLASSDFMKSSKFTTVVLLER